MTYKVKNIYTANNRTVIWLDKKPNIDDLGSTIAVLEGTKLKIEYVHPDGFILVDNAINSDNLEGRDIILS